MYPEKSVPNGSSSEHFFHIFLKPESSEVIILCKTVGCFPFRVHNTDQSIKTW